MYYIPTFTRKAYARITQSPITSSFFAFSLIYCLVQSVLQSVLLSVDVEYSTLVSSIVKGGNIPPANFTFLEGQGGHLHLQVCNDIPSNQIPYPCTTVFHSIGAVQAVGNRQTLVLDGWEKDLNVTTIFSPSNATNVVGVRIKTFKGPIVSLNEQCVQNLLYPSQILRNFRYEDIIWLCFQLWLLTISVFVILHGSVPHTLAALITRALETGWAVYATWRGPAYRANFQELLADPGTPCSLDLFSAYWRKRYVFEITDLVVCSTGLIVFSYLSWKLLKVYNAQSFKCVGAPQHVMRIHKFFMAVLASLQLEVFVLVISMGLWIKVLTETAIAHISSHTTAYKALYIGTMILLLPWIALGWYSIRLEMKRMMIFFIGIGFVITTGWSIMFYSIVYRWSFVQWPYLGCYTVASFILLIASMALGVVCRMNFGKGFAQYLHAEAMLASMNFAPDSFSHDTHRTNAHLSKELDTKILHLYFEDKYNQSTPHHST